MRFFTRIALLCFGLLLGTLQASAQVFEPGYVVLAAGDTLRGEVENNYWSAPPKDIRFRPTAQTPPTTYLARQLRGVHLESGRLLRREVLPIDYTVTSDLKRMPEQLRIEQRPDTVLADVLVTGAASLLMIEDGNVKHYFVQREQRPYIELVPRKHRQNQGGITKVVDANNYRGQLELYFLECPSVVAALPKTAFTETGLTNLVQLYNRECSTTRQPGSTNFVAKDRSRYRVVVGPTFGVRYNSHRLRLADSPGLEPPTLDGLQADGRPHGQLGVFFDLLFPGRQLALHTAISRANFGRTAELRAGGYEGTLDWRGSFTAIEIGLRYLRPLGTQFQLVAGTGLQLFSTDAFQRFEANELRYTTTPWGRNVVSRNEVYGFESTRLPYLEVGLRQDRLTLMLQARRYGLGGYYDPVVVRSVAQESGMTYSSGYNYKARTLSLTLSLAVQINRNTDAKE
ncbi:hypothetical protein [Solirubrum puertoriconensis]|uniref:Outer membrane protein beta-barrel domain-containing protein n=1 Tax=Solirubrum puertoriconensis TaxID=1751427 RepID=A0A9X0L3C7_SOLP1|nr:hypothetical protein [Solirubrum puertoriconensis]KUG06395.1 hypothetical protein ASU33_03295 [Solirubrum puertoriconensis]